MGMKIQMNWPNILTIFRIVLIPIMIVTFYLPYNWGNFLTAFLFFLASFTDWLDGYLARVLQQSSSFGAFLDPVADKLLVIVALVLLVSDKNVHFIVLPALVIIAREVIISALREWMAEMGKRASIAVNFIGKLKTTLQMMAITFLLFRMDDSYFYYITLAGYILIHIAAFLTVWSMFVYIKIAWPNITNGAES